MLEEPCHLALFQEEMMLLYRYLHFCLFFFQSKKLLLILVVFHTFAVFVKVTSENHLHTDQQMSLLKVWILGPYFGPANSELWAWHGGSAC